jgi:hypothetical protein
MPFQQIYHLNINYFFFVNCLCTSKNLKNFIIFNFMVFLFSECTSGRRHSDFSQMYSNNVLRTKILQLQAHLFRTEFLIYYRTLFDVTGLYSFCVRAA